MPTIHSGSHRRRVALFSTNFASYSQTFVYDEVASHERYAIDVFAHNRLNAAAFPWNSTFALSPANSLVARVEWFLYGLTTFSPSQMARIRAGGYALLHAHFGPGSIYALTYKRAARAPLITTFHGYDVPLLLTSRRFLPAHWRYWWRSGAMLRRVDRFLAASDELATLLIRLGAPREKVRICRLGVRIPAAPNRVAKTGRNILMVGRFVEKKGFEYGIEAFGALLASGMDCHLHLIGDGPLRPRYDRLATRLGIRDRVSFLGIRPHPEALGIMDRMDVLIAPSVVAANGDRESGLIVVKEASARGLPVVGTRHGGIPEIIDDAKTGFLVPERNSRALASALASLLRDAGLRETLGHAGRAKMMAEYDIVQCVRELETHYDEVIDAHAGRNVSA